jgi:hypothetical protein
MEAAVLAVEVRLWAVVGAAKRLPAGLLASAAAGKARRGGSGGPGAIIWPSAIDVRAKQYAAFFGD